MTRAPASHRPCPGCGSGSAVPAGAAHDYEIVSCAACRTLFTSRLPQEEKDYGGFYAEGRALAVPEFVLGRLEQTVAALASYRSALNRWLDVGCGTGTLLRAAANGGWDALGTEVAPAAVEAVRASGLQAVVGTTRELTLPEGGFDVVSMIEVIEHVPDPDELLEDAARLLRPGGALYLTTPHGRGLAARLLGTRWSVVTPPDHLQLFSTRGLRAALQRTGFRVRTVVTHGVNPYELRAGMRRRGRPDLDDRGPSNTETSYQLNESLSTRRSGRAVKRIANGALSAGRLGDTLKVVAERAPA